MSPHFEIHTRKWICRRWSHETASYRLYCATSAAPLAHARGRIPVPLGRLFNVRPNLLYLVSILPILSAQIGYHMFSSLLYELALYDCTFHTPAIHVRHLHARFLHTVQATNTMSLDRKSTRLNSSHSGESRMPSSA